MEYWIDQVMKQETVITRYSVSEATNTRDAMAKCLYNALFDYIVLRVNQALLKNHVTAKGYYIGKIPPKRRTCFRNIGHFWLRRSGSTMELVRTALYQLRE